MIDCMSNGRLISGFARGIPREYKVYNVAADRIARPLRGSLGDHREGLDGRGLLLPRQVLAVRRRRALAPAGSAAAPAGVGPGHEQQRDDRVGRAGTTCRSRPAPAPAVCAKMSFATTRSASPPPATRSRPITSSSRPTPASPTRRKTRSPRPVRMPCTSTARCSATATTRRRIASAAPATSSSASFDYVRPENMGAVARAREDYRDLTMEQLAKQAQTMPWGPADEVTEKIIDTADHAGASTVLVSLNRGVMPHEMFLEQVQRFAAEVLPGPACARGQGSASGGDDLGRPGYSCRVSGRISMAS